MLKRAAVLTAIALAAGGGADRGELEIKHPQKGLHEATLAVDVAADSRVRVSLRLVGRTIEGKRRIVDTAVAEENVPQGRATVTAALRGALDSCFGYVRCDLVAGAGVAPLETPEEFEPAGHDEHPVPTGMPRIKERPIPYGAKRRSQMADYSKRHYGEREWRLEPRGIVQHYTASSTLGPALNTFIQNRPDVEYHELPGVCAHYIIDTDGTILELVPTGTRCRHTVGLNHETIGIEHVGNSDSDVVGRPRVLRSSLALTSWLRCAYGIERANVIGHNESLDSPLYKELDPDFQGRTHGDMKPGTMRRYRAKLGGC
jgi:beta-N-acetylhexosaminidase